MGDLAVESAWGWQYSINDVLQGDEKPCFYAIDKDGDGHRVYLDEHMRKNVREERAWKRKKRRKKGISG